MIRFLGKVLLLIPFFYLEYSLIIDKSYPATTVEYYYFGFLLLGFFGSLSILLNINKILGIFYILLSFGLYCYFYDRDIFNLWPVGGLILLINGYEIKKVGIQEKKKSRVKGVGVQKKVKQPLEKILEPVARVPERVVEDYWVRYDRRVNKNKPILIKLKEKINKLVGNK